MSSQEKVRQPRQLLFTPLDMPKPIKNLYLRRFVQIAGWLILALLPMCCLFTTELIHYANRTKTINFFTNRDAAVWFDLCVMYLIWLCVLCLLKKGWVSVLVYGAAFALIAYANYLKHAMTGDYLYPWDILEQAGNAGELMQFITVPFPPQYAFLLICQMALAVPVFFSGAELPLRWYIRIPAMVLAVVCAWTSVSTPEKATQVLNQNSLYLEDMALQTSNYSANGFVGAFSVNVLSSNIAKPEDYSEDTITTLMENYTDQPASESFSSPDIILILSESFWDPTLLPGTTFSEDPLAEYREVCSREGVISGQFFTTGLGGGTVRPEFEVLTGLSTDYLPSGCVPWQYITEESESYVSLYKDLGYATMAIHPYTSSFYCRKTAYPLIGIDELHFEDDIYALSDELGLTIRGKQISDDTFADAIMYYMEQNGSDSPQFVFGISMENHQPYPDKFDTQTITVENPAFDADVANAVSNFTQGVADASKCLEKLTEFVDSREKDTILIWFGDHLPTLGSNLAAYRQSGALAEGEKSSYEFLYSTPFVIYSNFELQESTMLREGAENNIPSYNLMNAVAQLIGAPRTAYMDYLEDYSQAVPYYNVRLKMTLKEDTYPYVNAHKLLTYDRLAGGKYSLP